MGREGRACGRAAAVGIAVMDGDRQVAVDPFLEGAGVGDFDADQAFPAAELLWRLEVLGEEGLLNARGDHGGLAGDGNGDAADFA